MQDEHTIAMTLEMFRPGSVIWLDGKHNLRIIHDNQLGLVMCGPALGLVISSSVKEERDGTSLNRVIVWILWTENGETTGALCHLASCLPVPKW
jgi:hypothetical protein